MTGYAIAAVLWVLGMFPVANAVEETYKKALSNGLPPAIVVASGLIFLALWPLWTLIGVVQKIGKAVDDATEPRE